MEVVEWARERSDVAPLKHSHPLAQNGRHRRGCSSVKRGWRGSSARRLFLLLLLLLLLLLQGAFGFVRVLG
jgi:hypothetical protein